MAGVHSNLFLFLMFNFFLLNSVILGKECSSFKILNKRGTVSPPESCVNYKENLLTVQEKNYLVWLHMNFRQNFSTERIPKPFYMRKLSWNENLAKMAQRWAEKCTMSRNSNLQIGNQPVGQLVSVVDERKVKSVKDLFHEWELGFNKLTPEIIEKYKKPQVESLDYEPAAQLLWGNTSQVGCGRSSFKPLNCTGDKKLNCSKNTHVVELVCNYFPAGNKLGAPVYLTKTNSHLVCDYDSKYEGCKQLTEEKPNDTNKGPSRVSPMDRIRNRMIQLWPAAGKGYSLKAKWESLLILFLLFLMV